MITGKAGTMNTILNYDNTQEITQNHPFKNHWTVYERFAVTTHLLFNNYHEFILSLDKNDVVDKLLQLLASQNISDGDFGKLIKKIDQWNKVQAPIPLQYVELIGLKPVSVITAAKADMKNFKAAISCTLFTDSFYLKTESGLIRICLPDLTPEKEAVEFVRRYKHTEEVKNRYLFFRELKTIVIEPSGSFYTLTWPPVLVLQNNLFVPALIKHDECTEDNQPLVDSAFTK
jgi:hypothetical protein